MATSSAVPSDPNWKPPPGRVGNLTVPQQHALEKLKKELQAEGHFDENRYDDPFLLRFLRARKFDLVATKTMLLAAEKWRKDFGVEDIIKNFDWKEKEAMDAYYPQYYHKIDKEGRPIYIERLGKVDLAAMYKISTQERLLQHLVWEYEKFEMDRLPACSARVGHPVETSCTVLDLAGVGIKKFWDVKAYLSDASKISQDCYPERMGKFYVINAPWGFSTVWNMIKGWLDPVTQEKIKILGSNYQKDLLDAIDADSLPADLGGTCKCAKGCSLSDAGPWNEIKPVKANGDAKEEVIKTGTTM